MPWEDPLGWRIFGFLQNANLSCPNLIFALPFGFPELVAFFVEKTIIDDREFGTWRLNFRGYKLILHFGRNTGMVTMVGL